LELSIKAAAFDYGGVISFFQDGEAITDMANLAGIDATLMSRIYWENRHLYDKGLMGGKEYFKNILAGVGVFADTELQEKLLVRDNESWSHVNPKTEQLMKDLKASDYKVAVISNIGKEILDQLQKTLPVFNVPDEAIYSCDVNMVKPEEKIFSLLLSRLDCNAEEVVFFDDREVNVSAALALGIQAFLWNGPEAARKNMEVLGAGQFGK
jgi:putative hydrolase of the HAD superfamily